MKKSQSASFTLLLLSALCLAEVSAQRQSYTNLTVTSGSEGFTFNPGDYFGDINGYHLTFESNCNLVLYNGQTPLWASASWQDNNPNCIAVFQSDGNLVVYSSNERVSTNALWAAGTWTQIQVASLQINNGHLQVVETYNGNYNVVLDVSNPPPRSTQRPFRNSASPSILVKSTDENDFVFQQQQYIGDLDNTNLIFQYDCNFVLYDPSGPLWASGTVRDARYICELAVKRDGSLVIYAADNPSVVYWTWDGNNDETEEEGEIISTELAILDGSMQVVHSLSDGSTRTYSTVNGDLTLIY